MNLFAQRRAAREAERRLDAEYIHWQANARTLRGIIARHPFAWSLGGGFASGFVAGWLPWRTCLRIGTLATDAATLMLRVSADPLLAALRDLVRRRANGARE
ncbi:MAG: hypothetical protein GXC76_11350 [Rhodanobacteraceae bacterium]|jgi:hypothetical protein|nr:hypothetical protein [Rhodanobacteraceae bacterium]